MFKKLKLKIQYYILSRDLLRLKRISKLVTLSEVNKIGVLFDAKNSQSVIVVKSFLNYLLKKNIDVDILGFIDDVKKDSMYLSTIHINYFKSEDLNMLGIPKSLKTNQFMQNKYDIIINLSLNNSFSTKYLTLMSNSKYRIGVYGDIYKFNYDLMFKLKVQSLDYFIEQLKYYLELIDKNNEK